MMKHEQKCNDINKSKDEIITILQQTIKEEKELFKQQLVEIMNKNCKTL